MWSIHAVQNDAANNEAFGDIEGAKEGDMQHRSFIAGTISVPPCVIIWTILHTRGLQWQTE